MATMRCSECGRLGIYWENLSGLSPYTYCPHCKARRLPVPEEPEEQDEDDDAAEREKKP